MGNVEDGLVGLKVVEVRKMTIEELEAEGWEDTHSHAPPTVLVLEGGVKVYPARDEEGNGPGSMFMMHPEYGSMYV